MGRANVLHDENYLYAWGASMENIPIAEDFKNYSDEARDYNQASVDHEHIYIPIDYETPETVAIKHELFEKLSDEAKEVFSIILNAPLEIITPVSGNISKSKLMRYCRNKLGELKTNSVFSELKDYLMEIVGC